MFIDALHIINIMIKLPIFVEGETRGSLAVTRSLPPTDFNCADAKALPLTLKLNIGDSFWQSSPGISAGTNIIHYLYVDQIMVSLLTGPMV